MSERVKDYVQQSPALAWNCSRIERISRTHGDIDKFVCIEDGAHDQHMRTATNGYRLTLTDPR